MPSATSRNIVKISAAGSGKTWDICHDALELVRDSGNRVLITTYTNRGAESIRNEIRKQNSGVLHPSIFIKTWYSFMMSDMIKPYQQYILGNGMFNILKSFDYSQTYGHINYQRRGTQTRYITTTGNVRSNEASELVVCLNEKSGGKVINRLEEVYNAIFFDEIQDLAGYDIELVRLLIDSNISIVCCGDNKQATFSTHNTKKNKGQTGKNIWEFFIELERRGLVTVQKNLASRRFNKQICCFANKVFQIGDPITTIMDTMTGHDGVFLISVNDVNIYHRYFLPQVLIFDAKTNAMGYHSVNFGACKGETFSRVLVFPNGPLKDFLLKGKAFSAPEKYYVAVTRPKFSIAFAMPSLPDVLEGFTEELIDCGETKIRVLRFIA